MNPIHHGASPPSPDPAQQSNIANQLAHTQQPAANNISIQPEKPARWGTIVGRGIVLLIKAVAYVAFSPFLLLYMAGVVIGTGFSGKATKECFYDLLEPLKEEIKHMYLGKIGYVSAEEYAAEMRKNYFESEKQKRAQQEIQAAAQPPAPQPHPAANPAPQVNPPQAGHAGGPPLNPPPPNPPPNLPDL